MGGYFDENSIKLRKLFNWTENIVDLRKSNRIKLIVRIFAIVCIGYLFYQTLFYQSLSLSKSFVYLSTKNSKLSKHWLILTSKTQLEKLFNLSNADLSVIFIDNTNNFKLKPRKENVIIVNSRIQSKFSFHSTNLRNLAYLIAIQHGAQFIYESIANIPFKQSENIQHFTFRRQRSPLINIYPTFTGNFTQITPGLPKNEWLNITQDGWSAIRTVDSDRETIRSLIQQEILLENQNTMINHPPVAVEPLTFVPFANENILFKYDAFWALNMFESKSVFWRSWWTQRMLADIDGHLSFSSSISQQNLTLSTNIKEDENVSKLVRYLSTWKSTKSTLIERIEQLFKDLNEQKLCEENDLTSIQNWIKDLKRIKYIFPPIKIAQTEENSSGSIRRRRTAVCLTGLVECIEEGWRPTAHAIRTHIQGDMDIFMYLSSTEPVVDQLSTKPLSKRIVEALRYSNFTVKVLFENLPTLDPHYPPNCTSDKSVNQPEHKIPRYYQQLFGLSNCFSLVRDYEKKHGIRYELMVRSRGDLEFLSIPSTFDRPEPNNINTTLVIPPNRYGSQVDDGFAVGPIDSIEVYMNRYFSFQQCLTPDLHPERYLYFYLKHKKVKLNIDSGTVVGHIPHSPKHCH